MAKRPGLRDQLLGLGPHAGAHHVAIRAALSVIIPLLVLLAIDRLDLAMFAAFGAFTSLYGRNRVRLPRVQMQLIAAGVLVASVAAGSLVAVSEQRLWLSIAGAVVVAGLTSLVSDAEDWHPPGPLFAVFAFAGTASLPTELSLVPQHILVAVLSAVLSLLIGSTGTIVRRNAGRPAMQSDVPLQRGDYRMGAGSRIVRRRTARYAIGVAAAGLIAMLAGIGHPYWAMVSAAVPLAAAEAGLLVAKGLQRMAGTVVGVGVAWLILLPGLDPIWVILIIGLAQAGAELLVGRNYGLALLAITPLALLSVHLSSQMPVTTLLVDRTIESIIGATVGIVVGLATRRWRRQA